MKQHQEERLKLKDIEPNPNQPRKDFNEEELKELAENIKQVGLKQSLIVRPLPTGGKGKKYQLVDGERRYRACKLINLEEVPVEIREDIKTEKDATMESFILNHNRSGYKAQDKEAYINYLNKTVGLSTRKIAARLGLHHSSIDHYLEAYRFRQKVLEILPAYQVGTLSLSFTALKQTAFIKDMNLRIAMIQAIQDKRIKSDQYEIARAASILFKLPKEAWEAYFRKLMTLEELEFYLIKNPKYVEEKDKEHDELDKKLKEGKITEEQYHKHPLNKQEEPLTLIPTIKSSELLPESLKQRFIENAELIKEDRFTPAELQLETNKKWLEEQYKKQQEAGYDWLDYNAAATWGKACEDGVIQATEDIQDPDLRKRVVELVLDYRFATWFQQVSRSSGDEGGE